MDSLKVTDLSFSYSNERKIIDNISLKIDAGSIVSILGPNGSGKTTLLKLILGLLERQTGTIEVFQANLDSMSLKERAKKLAYVPQKHKAVFAYKVIDIVAMGKLPYSGVFCITSHEDYLEAAEMLEKMNLIHLSERPYNEISGGEQQLVMICRALLQRAEILILDEPVTGLDYGNQLMLLKKLKELSQTGITCIMTTHYPEHALWTSDFSIFLKKGKIVASGKTDDIITSEMLYELYNAHIKIVKTSINESNISTCVPLI
ncbi:MAG: ABC transporter ATP-binding protein [Candidatus Riflebacteria bacterium]|nr:ABC transporter ATP-binding protein [Candidatus Riflebacteria bacterium]